MDFIPYQIEAPKKFLPIFMIGAGGIVNDAHLPAYKLAGFSVEGIYDLDTEKAVTTAHKFGIPKVFHSLREMLDSLPEELVFDVALPATALLNLLPQLPQNANVLIQKPMGVDLKEATQILELARKKNFTAGVNFQLRYAPYILAARSLVNQGVIGELCNIEINVNVFTPWHLWPFLYDAPRVEILYHSIHYIDLVRSFLGNPLKLYAKTLKHPKSVQLASVRSTIIMDYGETIGSTIVTNHCHNFGLRNQHAYIKFEGTKGAIKIRIGTLLNYPTGIPDAFEYIEIKNEEPPQWNTVLIEGSWFPNAFVGSMAQIMRAAEGSVGKPDNSLEDCLYTMACVEAAYLSDKMDGVRINDLIE